jgi:hypothetical protein
MDDSVQAFRPAACHHTQGWGVLRLGVGFLSM